ncbi:MAG: hypothetical protein J5824_01430 [Lachnospiraceae bacterium]|nr:hypothetical protein [Lachnospiraceae bacterium]
MEFILEILVDCVLSLIVDSGVEVMTGSEQSNSWPKGAKIALVAVTLLVFIGVTGALMVFGIIFLTEKDWVPGILLLAVGIIFAISMITKFVQMYRKKRQR